VDVAITNSSLEDVFMQVVKKNEVDNEIVSSTTEYLAFE